MVFCAVGFSTIATEHAIIVLFVPIDWLHLRMYQITHRVQYTKVLRHTFFCQISCSLYAPKLCTAISFYCTVFTVCNATKPPFLGHWSLQDCHWVLCIIMLLLLWLAHTWFLKITFWERHTERQRQRQREIETHTDTQTQRERRTERETERKGEREYVCGNIIWLGYNTCNDECLIYFVYSVYVPY